MANTIPASDGHLAHYGFNKLIVHDLGKKPAASTNRSQA